MIWRRIIIILAITFLTGNANAFRSRIINGQETDIEKFPYQVLLLAYDNSNFLCGGSIISEKHILTAGHCVTDIDADDLFRDLFIVSGTTYRHHLKGKIHEVSNIAIHPNYSNSDFRSVNDVAVITLKEPITFDKYRQKLNVPEHDVKVGQKATVTGFGIYKKHPYYILPKKLQMLETHVISNEECQSKVSNPEKAKIYDTEICTSRQANSGNCFGDSGGPLAANGEVIGIVTWSDENICAGSAPDVYTNVYKFKDFILSAMKN